MPRIEILALALALSSPALANEGGGEKKAEEAAPKAAGPEWPEIQNRLQTLKAKVAAKDKIVRELIVEKQSQKDPRKAVEIVENLKREHKELREAAEEYEQQRNLLKYRYPEKGLKEQQRYRRVEIRSLDDMETQMSMEGQLKRSLVKVRQQYGPPTEQSEAHPKKEEPAESLTTPKITEPPVMAK